jgi:hypothetical protein
MYNLQAEERMGYSQGMSNHSHDLVQELSVRLDQQWRYEQYAKNAQEAGMDDAAEMFRRFERENQTAIDQLRDHITRMAKNGTFV